MPLKTSNTQNTPLLWKAASRCSEQDSALLANQLGREIKPGDRVLLEGPMGVGKTTFARALLSSLGVEQPPEGSPTFAIAHEYLSPSGGVVHIDYYRIRSQEEIDEAGIPSYYWERNLIVISEWLSSWPEFEKDVIRTGRTWRVNLSFEPGESTFRKIEILQTRPSDAK
jgi:tRNA threonylcarbamoyladenosine biosynthesis protein TsaE